MSVANDLKQTTECAFVVSKTPELFEHFQIDQKDAIILFTNVIFFKFKSKLCKF